MSHGLIWLLLSAAPAQGAEPPLAGPPKGKSQANLVRYSPDGTTLAVVYTDGSVLLWDVRKAAIRWYKSPGKGMAFTAVFSPDGKHLVSDHLDDTLVVWEVATGKIVTQWTQDVASDPPVFARDGKTLYLSTDRGEVCALDFPSGKLKAKLAAHKGPVRALRLTPNGKLLISGGDDGRLVFWDLAAGKELAVVDMSEMGPIKSLDIAPIHGDVIAVGFSRGYVALVGIASRKYALLYGADTGGLFEVAFSPGGRFLAVCGVERGDRETRGALWMYDVLLRRPVGVCDLGPNTIMSVAFSPTNLEMATASSSGEVRFWPGKIADPLSSLKPRPFENSEQVGPGLPEPRFPKFVGPVEPEWCRTAELTGQDCTVLAIAFAPDGKSLASGGTDGSVCFWSPGRLSPLERFRDHAGEVRALAYSPDGRLLISGGFDRAIKVRNLTERRTASLAVFRGVVLCLAVSSDNGTLAVGVSDGTVHLWDLKTYQLRAIVTAHARPVYAVAFSRDGRTLATGGSDGRVRLWDLARGAERNVLEHPDVVRALTFGRDGMTLITAGTEGTVRIWDLETAEILTAHRGRSEMIWGLALNPRDDSLAMATLGAGVHVWGRGIEQRLVDFTSPVRCVAFAPDGYGLASGSGRQVILWAYGAPGK